MSVISRLDKAREGISVFCLQGRRWLPRTLPIWYNLIGFRAFLTLFAVSYLSKLFVVDIEKMFNYLDFEVQRRDGSQLSFDHYFKVCDL